MKGNDKVIANLNSVLTGELTAINQYFLHAKMLKDWGYNKLGDYVYKESIDEMKHADQIVDRILFLEGMPNLQKLDKLHIGETVPEMFACDLKLELINIPRVREGIAICLEVADHATRELLEHILVDEESHVDWIESQHKVISDVGIQNYLATQT